jgi:RHS repeat-associated protein
LRHAGTGTTLPTSGTAALYYHRNQQYSIVGLSDAAGTLVERYAYTAYGELTILAPDRTLRATSSFQNRYTYTGREWDAGLSLHYFLARWLEPKAGRFIGRDPIKYASGDFNLYGFVGNSPLRWLDPSGLDGIDPRRPEWHHLIPQEFKELFSDEINNAWNGWFLRNADHKELHALGWNDDWNAWINNFKRENKRPPNLDEAKGFLFELRGREKYACVLKRGFRSGWAYKQWHHQVKELKRRIGAALARKLSARMGKTAAKRGTRGFLASIPVLSIPFSLWDYPARAAEFGHGGAVGMTFLDNVPIVDISLAIAEGIDAAEQERIKFEMEAMQYEEMEWEKLLLQARQAGQCCEAMENWRPPTTRVGLVE